MRHIRDQFARVSEYPHYNDAYVIAQRNAIHQVLSSARVRVAQCRLIHVNCHGALYNDDDTGRVYHDSLCETAHEDISEAERIIRHHEHAYKYLNREVARRDLIVKLRYILQHHAS